ncbi:hypothetical protein BsWGS_16964 [Bradybaena similaris]
MQSHKFNRVLGLPAAVLYSGQNMPEQRLSSAARVPKPVVDKMIPPMTMPYQRHRWVPSLVDESERPSTFFDSTMVDNLDMSSFDQYIKGMEKALIMFYNPNQPDNFPAGRQFGRAADRKHHWSHSFGAVDCSINNKLCDRESAKKLPMFKLYSNGYDVSTIVHGKSMTADQMHMLMKMTPVLTSPRVDFGMGRIKL